MAAVRHAILFLSVAVLLSRSSVKAGPRPRWSGWYDRDDPTQSRDTELLAHIPRHPCGGDIPLYVEVQERTGSSWKTILKTDVMIHVGPHYGLKCRNGENKWTGKAYPECRDFSVRHTLRRRFFRRVFLSRASWIDRDDPTINGDFEPGHRLSTSIAFRTTPSSSVNSGWVSRLLHVGANYGLLCLNQENIKRGLGSCKDYRCRYLCPATGNPYKHKSKGIIKTRLLFGGPARGP